ncbi:MAG TPA: septum formation initiator family protein [Rubrobacteraceae bacterium]|nr:septum formation initiator family protein [Rubrobacteraceae bacterium]
MNLTRRSLRPLWVMLYAAFVGLLLASYVQPLKEIVQNRSDIPALEAKLHKTGERNTEQQRLIKELQTPAGIERAARERYGMIRDGEKVYIVEK